MALPPRVTLGSGSYFAEPPEVVAYGDRSRITVGRYSSIAKGVRFVVDAEHDTRKVTTAFRPGCVSGTRGDVAIGSDVWIGAFATVLSGVTIGDGAVVGAAAVVARDVPPYAVVVGNPARVVRYRFDPVTVARLLAIRWWDWPEERVAAAADLIWSDRVAAFVDRYDPAGGAARPPDVPPGAAPTVTVMVRAGGGRYPLWVPAADADLVRRAFERHAFGGLDRAWLRSPPVVLDVGAGAGVFALYARLAYHPGATVHCFEPCPAAAELLRANLGRLAGVAVHPVALGGADGTAELLLDPERPSAHALDPRRVPAPAGRVRVPVRHAGAAWDALGLDEVDVLKLDAGGSERDVLGALGPRRVRVRVALVACPSPDDRRRAAELLPGHVPAARPAGTPDEGIAHFVRADLAAPRTA